MISKLNDLSTGFYFLVDRLKQLNAEINARYPSKACHFCDELTYSDQWLCTDCHADLPWNDKCCERCALPLTSPLTHLLCGECQTTPPAFTLGISAFRYELPIDRAIQLLKYSNKRYFACMFAQLLSETVRTRYDASELPKVLIPVPIHRSKLKTRGFNQALLLSKQLSKKLKIPVDNNVLLKVIPTSSQANLNKAKRMRNLQGSFALQGEFRAQHVALVDDVMTTQATAEILAKLLLANGVKRVDLWSIARTAKLRLN